jgi:hypothetical protein
VSDNVVSGRRKCKKGIKNTVKLTESAKQCKSKEFKRNRDTEKKGKRSFDLNFDD